MSSDTYNLIRKRGNWFYLSMEFASDEAPAPIDPSYCRAFATLEEAMHVASEEYTEYGIQYDDEGIDEA